MHSSETPASAAVVQDAIVLGDERTRATIRSTQGARVQHLVDRRSGRELLYQRPTPTGDSDDYLGATTGGWDLMFPNDSPYDGHPDHGEVWNAPFDALRVGTTAAELTIRLDRPPVDVTRSFSLLGAPRAGLRETIRVTARDDASPFLLAPHPMLAVQEGWTVALPSARRDLRSDAVLPGRFAPDRALDAEAWAVACTVPDVRRDLCEVVYADGVASGSVGDPGGRHRTRVSWSAESLPHLWLCTVTGRFGAGAFLLLEPCTSRPYRLEEAVPAGAAPTLAAGQVWRGWIEVESLDGDS